MPAEQPAVEPPVPRPAPSARCPPSTARRPGTSACRLTASLRPTIGCGLVLGDGERIGRSWPRSAGGCCGSRRRPGTPTAGSPGWTSAGGRELDRPVEAYITCRMTHVFALGTLIGRPGARRAGRPRRRRAARPAPRPRARRVVRGRSRPDATRQDGVRARVRRARRRQRRRRPAPRRRRLLARRAATCCCGTSGATTTAWSSSSGTSRGATLDALPRRQRQHAHGRGAAWPRPTCRRRPAGGSGPLRITERVVHDVARGDRLAAARALRRGLDPAAGATTATSRPTRSGRTA